MKKEISKDLYAAITNRIIEKLESGVIPWRQPWKSLGLPRNLITQRPYRGINLLLLSGLGYPSNEFLTYKQVQDVGGKIKRGEKGHLVLLWIWMDEENPPVHLQDAQPKKKAWCRHYYVFNAAQCDGIPERGMAVASKHNDPIEACEWIVADMPNCPKIVHIENEAYYHRYADFINMPKMDAFESSEAYYATLFHELIHATGYEERLNRKELMDSSPFSSENYSIEELTAEIGACYLAAYAGIGQTRLDNNAAYIRSWLAWLKADKRFILYASAYAQRALDYILNIKHEDNGIVIQDERISV